MNDDTTDSPFTDTRTRKDVALSIGWQVQAYHQPYWNTNRWLLHAPNRTVYTNGQPAPIVAVTDVPGKAHFHSVLATLRHSEEDAWHDLPYTFEEISDGWKPGKAVSDD